MVPPIYRKTPAPIMRGAGGFVTKPLPRTMPALAKFFMIINNNISC